MKKLLILTALFGFSAVTLSGCGGRKEQVIEAATEADTGLSSDQKQSYEESMKSGAYGSSKSNPPPAK